MSSIENEMGTAGPTTRYGATRQIWLIMCAGSAAALAAIAAAIGVLFRGSGAVREVISVRGEPYVMATDGVYAYNAQRIVAEGAGWDVFTLFVVVPALSISLPFIWRRSIRAHLFAAGLLAYLFYQYFMYAMTWAYGPLFPLFVLIYALSLVGAIALLVAVGRDGVSAVPTHFPRRSTAAFAIVMSGVLLLMWAGRIAVGLAAGGEATLLGQTTLVVQAMDLGLVVPAGLFVGIALLRRRLSGYLFAPVYLVTATAMAAAILAMLLSAWAVEGELVLGPALLFAVATAAGAWLGLEAFGAVGTTKESFRRLLPILRT